PPVIRDSQMPALVEKMKQAHIGLPGLTVEHEPLGSNDLSSGHDSHRKQRLRDDLTYIYDTAANRSLKEANEPRAPLVSGVHSESRLTESPSPSGRGQG